MKIKTEEATTPQLNWLVAMAQGYKYRYGSRNDLQIQEPDAHPGYWQHWGFYNPSTDWSQGGPIIEREKVTLDYEASSKDWAARTPQYQWMYGDTPLVAAMRCYVASKLGEEIEIPTELT